MFNINYNILSIFCFCTLIITFTGCSENKHGSFLAQDKNNNKVILNWIKTNMISKEYLESMETAWNIAKPAYIGVEMSFLKTHPEAVNQDIAFKSFEPFFLNKSKINWPEVEKHMKEHLKSMFIYDTSNLPENIKKSLEKMSHYFITVQDQKTNKLLGFISFMIAPEFVNNEIKCIIFAVLPEEQNRGLGKILMSSIFKILPETKKIFLCTRVTNKKAQQAYYNWGFTNDLNPITQENGYIFNKDHWIFLEYKTDKSNILQNISKTFKNF